MEFDFATDRISIPVLIELEADRVKLLHEDAVPGDFEERAHATFRRFVARGLRARLATGNLLTGQRVVSLDFVAGAPVAAMKQGGAYPELPTLPADDLDSIMTSAKNLLETLQQTASRLNGLMSSPEIARSMRSLDDALANLDRITREARAAGVGPLVGQLRAAATSADAALQQADATLAVVGGALDGRRADGGDLAGAIREIRTAAQSVRILAEYLEGHPGSLILGRSEAPKR